MRFEKVWTGQYRATKGIKRHFGAKSALDYLIGEKLTTFAEAAEEHPEFAQELPRFLAAIWRLFNEYEIAGYVASQKARKRARLRQLFSCGDVARRAAAACRQQSPTSCRSFAVGARTVVERRVQVF